MTAKSHTLKVRGMWNEAQEYYLTEVLGVTATNFCGLPQQLARKNALVITTPVSDLERALLKKVLDSVRLLDFDHVVMPPGHNLASTPEVYADYLFTLHFNSHVAYGRKDGSRTKVWDLPSLSAMSGSGANVINAKKMAWSLLQQFRAENPL